MNKKFVVSTGIMLGISLVINIVLYLQNHSLTILIEDYKTSERVNIDERSVINALIPKIKPTITKEQLVGVIKSIKPDEKVYVLEDQIGWRFYHFWYSNDGKITDVTYGS
jgi:hypothetical protein